MQAMDVIDAEGLDRLEEFLVSDQAPEQSMMLDELDGFLTAVVCAPELIPDQEWMAEIWGDGEPAFDNEGQRDDILSLILGMKEYIEALLEEDDAFEPIYADDVEDEVVSAWCSGFVHGIGLREEAWSPLFREENNEPLIPILALATGGEAVEGDEPILREMWDDEATRGGLREAVPDCVQDIYDFWGPARP